MPPVAKKAAPKAAEPVIEPAQEPFAEPAAEQGIMFPDSWKQPEPELKPAPEAPAAEPELILVFDPCPKHYPGGWASVGQEEGVRATCEHLSAEWGFGSEMTKERAIELGYSPRGE